MVCLKNRVVCLVGSTRPIWRKKYREVLEALSRCGNAVFTVVWFKDDLPNFERFRGLLEDVHFRKIRHSQVVVCIDREAVGKHTKLEMDYAKCLGKAVYFFDEVEC